MQIIIRLCKTVFAGYVPALFHHTNHAQKARRLTFMFTVNKPENTNGRMLIMQVMEINRIALGIFCKVSILNWKKLLKIYCD